jgi:hypothetical protein
MRRCGGFGCFADRWMGCCPVDVVLQSDGEKKRKKGKNMKKERQKKNGTEKTMLENKIKNRYFNYN